MPDCLDHVSKARGIEHAAREEIFGLTTHDPRGVDDTPAAAEKNRNGADAPPRLSGVAERSGQDETQ